MLDALISTQANENYPTTVHTQTLPTSTGEHSDRAHDERSKRKEFKDVKKEREYAQAHLSLFEQNEHSTQQQEELDELAHNSPVHERTQPTLQLGDQAFYAPTHAQHHERTNNSLQQDTQLQHLNNLDALSSQINDIIQYLNVKTGKRFNNKTEANRKLIQARLRNGYTVQDCYQVIDNQVTLWQHDPKMQAYLRPQTLFRASNFESYLNNAVKQHELLFRPPARVELDFNDE